MNINVPQVLEALAAVIIAVAEAVSKSNQK
jgi:hypothetical protein